MLHFLVVYYFLLSSNFLINVQEKLIFVRVKNSIFLLGSVGILQDIDFASKIFHFEPPTTQLTTDVETFFNY